MTNLLTAPMRLTVTAQVDVPEGWLEFITGGPEGFTDIFMRGYCGYWLRGVCHEDEHGWLAFVTEGERSAPAPTSKTLELWRAGKPLPKGYLRFDRPFAAKCFKLMAEKHGVGWFEAPEADANTYDCAVQLGAFGELVYG